MNHLNPDFRRTMQYSRWFQVSFNIFCNHVIWVLNRNINWNKVLEKYNTHLFKWKQCNLSLGSWSFASICFPNVLHALALVYRWQVQWSKYAIWECEFWFIKIMIVCLERQIWSNIDFFACYSFRIEYLTRLRLNFWISI